MNYKPFTCQDCGPLGFTSLVTTRGFWGACCPRFQGGRVDYSAVKVEGVMVALHTSQIIRCHIAEGFAATVKTLDITYKPTLWSTFVLGKLTVPQLIKKFPTFCGFWKLVTVFIKTPHVSLSLDRSIQSIIYHLISCIFNLILYSHLRLGLSSGFFLLSFSTLHLSAPSYVPHAPPITLFSISTC